MNVKFIKVATGNLSSVPITDGQVIVCTDSNSIYYDMNSTRRRASSNGNASSYGLVKLSDSYTSSGGAASSGVAASSKAVADAYSELSGNITTLKTLNNSLFVKAVPNQGATTKLVITGVDNEQVYLFVGAGTAGTTFLLILAPTQSGSLGYKSLGGTNLVPVLRSNKVIELPTGNWTRGFIISYNNFNYHSE